MDDVSVDQLLQKAHRLRSKVGSNLHDHYVEAIYEDAGHIANRSILDTGKDSTFDWKLDQVLTSKVWGFPIMIALLTLVLWLTIAGANYPSSLLASLLLDTVYPMLRQATSSWPWWLSGVTVDGMYLGTAWVVSVMLPPMAIFFPLFTLLEDLGYLPRVAFNLDSIFQKAGGHGKQSLSMMMGFGCNAAGVISTRIIDSPRERLIAILTNNFSLCNGRWPTMIILSTIFVGAMAPAWAAGIISSLMVVGVALLGVFLTFVVSWGLSRTVLKGEASAFSLELPPYRPPRVLRTLYTSFIDRTISVLWRAVVFALPAGAAIWLVGNIPMGQGSLADFLVNGLDPVGWLFGLNGVILLAYVVAIPANEIVIPTILMLTVMTGSVSGAGAGPGVMFEPDSMGTLQNLLHAGGWTLQTAVSVMLFSLMHNPCSTTIYTIYKETQSAKWTTMAALMPIGLGLGVLLVLNLVWSVF